MIHKTGFMIYIKKYLTEVKLQMLQLLTLMKKVSQRLVSFHGVEIFIQKF